MKQDAPADARMTSARTLATIRWIALLAVIAVTIGGAILYWRYSELYPSTDNAYTGTDIVRVAAEVSGPVVHVYVTTDAEVETGEPLFDIDATPYEAALRGARAQFDAAASASGTAADDLTEAADTLETKRQALEDALSKYREAKQAQDPDQPPSSELVEATQSWQGALQAYRDAESAFDAAQDKELTVTTPTVQLRGAAAQLGKATHDRVKTHVTAPAKGSVSSLSLRPGVTIQAGAPVFAIVEGDQWWVNANFKETDLARIRVGQPAQVVLDMYPAMTFDGVVESISAGSGATFSVLPPENATGNWVKVTQRFPVRVSIADPGQSPDQPLRAGASATVTVDTTEDNAQDGE